MAIAEVGQERDRQVAELRNDACVNGVYIALCTPCNPTIPECDGGCNGPKPYSTDIAAAFELWDEMKERFGEHITLVSDRKKSRCIVRGIDFTSGDYEGKTVADAISGAYVQLRGGQS